jgi:hypothetical protein
MIRKKPYDIHTAFNNIILEDVKVLGVGLFAILQVLDENDNVVAELKKEYLTQNNLFLPVVFDVKEVVKTLFKDEKEYLTVSPNIASANLLPYYDKNIRIEYKVMDETGYKFCFYAINAVSQIGQQTNLQDKRGLFLTNFERLKCYEGYPLDVTVMAFSGENYYYLNDSTTIKQINNIEGSFCLPIPYLTTMAGINNGGDLNVELSNNAGDIITDNDGNILYFSLGELTERNKVVENCCLPKNPFYVRWINNLGGWDYWLFSRRQYETKEIDSISTFEPYVEEVSNSKKLTEVLSVTGKKYIVAGSEDLTDNEFEVISQILFSNNIQYYDKENARWLNCYIKDGSCEKDNYESKHSLEIKFMIDKILMPF